MEILMVGSGDREHTLIRKLKESNIALRVMAVYQKMPNVLIYQQWILTIW